MLGEVKRETQSSHMLEQRRPLVMPAGKTQRMLWAAGALVIPTDARPGAAVAHAIAGGAAPSTDSVRRPRHRRAGAGPGPAGCVRRRQPLSWDGGTIPHTLLDRLLRRSLHHVPPPRCRVGGPSRAPLASPPQLTLQTPA